MFDNVLKKWFQKRAQESPFERDQISFKEEFRILEDLDMERSSAKVVDFFLVKNNLPLEEYKVNIQNVDVKSYAENSAWFDGSANGLIVGPDDSYPIKVNLTNGNIWTVSLLEQKTSQAPPSPSYIESPVRNIVERYRKKKYLPDKPPKPFTKKPTLRTPEILGRPRLRAKQAQEQTYLVHVPDYEPATFRASSPEGALSKYLKSWYSKNKVLYFEDEEYLNWVSVGALIKKLKERGLERYVTTEFSTVPYVLGLSFDKAKKRIEELGLSVGELTHATLPGMGNVVKQIPHADKDVPRGSTVKIKLGGHQNDLLGLRKLVNDLSRPQIGRKA